MFYFVLHCSYKYSPVHAPAALLCYLPHTHTHTLRPKTYFFLFFFLLLPSHTHPHLQLLSNQAQLIYAPSLPHTPCLIFVLCSPCFRLFSLLFALLSGFSWTLHASAPQAGDCMPSMFELFICLTPCHSQPFCYALLYHVAMPCSMLCFSLTSLANIS